MNEEGSQEAVDLVRCIPPDKGTQAANVAHTRNLGAQRGIRMIDSTDEVAVIPTRYSALPVHLDAAGPTGDLAMHMFGSLRDLMDACSLLAHLE